MSERFGIGCSKVLNTAVRTNGKLSIHVANPRNQANQITKGTCIGTFSREVEDSAVNYRTDINANGPTVESQEGKAACIDKMARELSNTADIAEGPKHRLYKLIKTNADLPRIAFRETLFDPVGVCGQVLCYWLKRLTEPPGSVLLSAN